MRDSGGLSNDLQALEKWIGRLRKAHGKEVRLRVCYEAGPTGFVLARRLAPAGNSTSRDNAVADSAAAGRADQDRPARRAQTGPAPRAGELTPVDSPMPTDDHARPVRARTDRRTTAPCATA